MRLHTTLGAVAAISLAGSALAGGQCARQGNTGNAQLVMASWTAADHHRSHGDDKATKNIVETAVAAGSFTTLAAAIEGAGLIDALSGKGPFTVFAPTDEAFAKLPPGTVEELLKPENLDTLKSILTFHVVTGRVPAAQVVTLSGATTLNGQQVEIEANSGAVRVNGALVTQADVKATNGVIHVIDTVILRPSDR